MSYKLTYFNDSAEGKHGSNGVPYYEAAVDVQASLADIDWLPGGSIARDEAFNIFPKSPANGHWLCPAASPALITLQPASVTVTAEDITESLSIAAYARALAAGVPTEYTCTYQWYSNNENNYTAPTIVEGETSATYAIPTDSAAGTYYYFCVVTANSITLNSAIATVHVDAAP